MAVMAADAQRDYDLGVDALIDEIPVKASTLIYEGAAVGEDGTTGYVRGLVAGDTFHGMAERRADNSSGAAGAIRCAVRRQGSTVLTISDGGLTVANLNDDVYASEDGTFTITAGANTKIGKITRYISATKALVFFQGIGVRSI